MSFKILKGFGSQGGCASSQLEHGHRVHPLQSLSRPCNTTNVLTTHPREWQIATPASASLMQVDIMITSINMLDKANMTPARDPNQTSSSECVRE